MHGVGPSTVLGGRYAVQRRLAQMPGAETWSAHDTTLERDVVVVCLPEDHPNAAAALDAARRAAGHDNHRLVRVLDVGRSDGIAFRRSGSAPITRTEPTHIPWTRITSLHITNEFPAGPTLTLTLRTGSTFSWRLWDAGPLIRALSTLTAK